MDFMGPPPFSVKALAERWGCSRQHVYDLIDAGELEAFPIGSREKGSKKLWRIAAVEVARWEAKPKAQSTGLENSKDNSSSSGGSAVADAAFASVRQRQLKLVRS